MNKKVVFLGWMNFNDSSAGAARVRMYSNMLQAEGVEIRLYSIYDFNRNKLPVSVLNRKYMNFLSYPLKLLLYVLSTKNLIGNKDIVFYLYPTGQVLPDYLLILYLKKIKKQKIFLEVNEVRRYGQRIKPRSAKYFKYVLYERLARYFDGLVCISKNIELYYKAYNCVTLRVPILSDTEFTYKNNCNYRSGEVFNIGFTGSVSPVKENFEVFFAALSKLHKKGFAINLNLYGAIYSKDLFCNLVDFYNLDDVIKYHGVVQQDLLPEVIAKQDLLVLPRSQNQQNQQNKYGFSTKLSEYLVSGVPVLITDVSDNLEYLTPNKDCLLADSEISKSFATQIENLIIDYNLLAPELARNAFLTAKENFNYLVHSKDFKCFLFE